MFKTKEENPRWNGGISEYPDHTFLKKQRIQVLLKTKGKCTICKNIAVVVHHIDESKDNHNLNNLIPLCESCHCAVHKREYIQRGKIRSKFIDKYGMTLKEMGLHFDKSPMIIRYHLVKAKDHTFKNKIEEYALSKKQIMST